MFGFVCFVGNVLVFVAARVRSVAWRLAALGLLAFAIVCAAVAWMPWNMRFLILPFALFALNGGLFLGDPQRHTAVRATGLILMGFCAIAYPLYSFNKGPQHIALSLQDREAMVFLERPVTREVYNEVRRRSEKEPVVLLVHASGDTWTLPFLASREWTALPTPGLTEADVSMWARRYPAAGIFVLAMDRALDAGPLAHLDLIRAFPEARCWLYKVRREQSRGPLRLSKVKEVR